MGYALVILNQEDLSLELSPLCLTFSNSRAIVIPL
jgi:hypothetical protein